MSMLLVANALHRQQDLLPQEMNNTTSILNSTDGERPAPEIIVSVAFELLLMNVIALTNGLVVVAICRFSYLQTVTNYFLASVAVADLLFAVALPLHITLLLRPELAVQTNFCMTRIFILLFPGTASVSMLVLVAIDRYLAILHPLHYRAWMTPRLGGRLILAAWVWSTLSTLNIYLYNQHEDGTMCSFSTSLHLLSNYWSFVFFILSMVFLLATYSRIMFTAWKQLRKMRTLSEMDTKRSRGLRSLKQEARTAKTLAIVMGAFICSWTPVELVIFLKTTGVEVPNYQILYTLSVPFVLINSCMNPAIYAWRNHKFRTAFKQLLLRSEMRRSVGHLTTRRSHQSLTEPLQAATLY